MKQWTFLLILLLATNTAGGTELDKRKHAQAGALISIGARLLNQDQPAVLGLMLGCAAGMAKELYDALGYGQPDIKDFAYTCVAAGVNVFLRPLYVYPAENTIYIGWKIEF